MAKNIVANTGDESTTVPKKTRRAGKTAIPESAPGQSVLAGVLAAMPNMMKSAAKAEARKVAEANAGNDSTASAQRALDITQRNVADITESKARLEAAAQEAPAPERQMNLFPEDVRVIPNYLARSPLFGAVKPGKRARRENEVLATPQGLTIVYTGPQLDQADCDVFLQMIHLAGGKKMSEPISIRRYEFLDAIRRDNGGKNYKWLIESIARLKDAGLVIDGARYKLNTSLVLRVIQDKTDEMFHVWLDPDLVEAFGHKDVSFINWEKRLQIEKQVPLSKWLLNYMNSHERGLQQWRVAYIKELYGYASPVRLFRPILREALEQLQELEIIAGAEIYENGSKVRYTKL